MTLQCYVPPPPSTKTALTLHRTSTGVDIFFSQIFSYFCFFVAACGRRAIMLWRSSLCDSQTGSLLEQATEAQSIKSGCFGHVHTQTFVSWKLMTETSWFWLLVLCCKWPHLRRGALFEHGSQSLLYMPCTQPNEWEGLIEVNAKTSYNDNSCTMYAFF